MINNKKMNKSKKYIREAFTELLEEKKDISKITVKELIIRADISKSTFYEYYSDIYAVMEEFEDEVILLLTTSIDDYVNSHEKAFMPYIDKIVQYLKAQEDTYRKIITNDSNSSITYKLKNVLIDKIAGDEGITFFSKDKKTKYAEIDFVAAGVIDLFYNYFKSKPSEFLTLDQIGRLVNDLLIKLAK